MGVEVADSHSGGKLGGACAQGRPVRVWGGGNSIKPLAWSFKSNVRAAMSLSRPAPLRQFQSSHRRRESAVRCQSGCCTINARNSVKSSPESVRPWRQIGSTALRFYAIPGREFSRKRPNSPTTVLYSCISMTHSDSPTGVRTWKPTFLHMCCMSLFSRRV